MSNLIAVLGGMLILAGVWIGALPEQLRSAVAWDEPSGRMVAATIRIVVGSILMVAAPATRYPKGLRIFGAAVLAAGFGILLVPIEHWSRLIQWVLFDQPALYRVGGSVGGFLLGAFLLHASTRRPPALSEQ